MQQQFAHSAHHKIQHQTSDGINQNNARASKRNGFSRAHKQASTNTSTNGNHFHLALA